MIPFSSAVSGGLAWSKIPGKRGHQLKQNGKIVGDLQPFNFWSSKFRANSAHGMWEFRRTGCFGTATEILDSNSHTRLAVFKPNLSGAGRLDFSDGKTYRITAKGFWRPAWTVLADNGQPILTVDSCQKTVRLLGELRLSEESLTLLALFTWQVMKQTSEDAASVAATVAATF